MGQGVAASAPSVALAFETILHGEAFGMLFVGRPFSLGERL